MALEDLLRYLLALPRGPLLLLLPLLIPIYKLIRALADPLRTVPGPTVARFTRLWKLRAFYRGDFEKTNIALHRKYGKIVRIAPGEYSIDDPSAAKVIYGHGNNFVKAPWYYAWGSVDPHAADLFSDLDPARHAIQRRKYASAFSMTALLQMEQYVDGCTELLRRRFSEFAASGERVDVAHWLQCYAFDVVGELTVGKRFGFLDSGEDISGIIEAINSYLRYGAHVGIYRRLHPLLSRVNQFLAKGKEGGFAFIAVFTQRQIDERLYSGKETGRQDFLTRFLGLQAQDPEKFTWADVMAGCTTNIGAGSDTTSISLSSVVYNLWRHPECLKKLREELDGKVDGPVSFRDAQEFPYLQAVLKEALRVHPATGLPLVRVVPRGGAMLAGRFFKEGTVVGINSWVAHNNKVSFGADADGFRPERWLESKEKSMFMDRNFFAFGMGSRTCIGKHISLMEMSKVMPMIVQNFDFEFEGPWTTKNHWFVAQKFRCRVLLRRAQDPSGTLLG